MAPGPGTRVAGPGVAALGAPRRDAGPRGASLLRSGWTALGLGGTLAMTLAGPRLVAAPGIRWWFDLRIPPGRAGNMVVFYAGMLALSLAWLGLGQRLRRARSRDWPPPGRVGEIGQVRAVAALWGMPLIAGPALFSSDMYSYLAQGTILAHGLSPYRVTPLALARIGEPGVLAAVSPFWRATTAPYGPLFLGIVRSLLALTGGNLIAGVVACRLVEVAGLILVARFVPRLARTLGADGAVATWLALASPLVLLELVAAGHNDALMAGLLVAGVTLALEGRPMAGIALCALGATVKLPALAGLVLIAVAHVRAAPARGLRMRRVVAVLAITAGVGAAVSLATGLGLGWISSTVISTPGKVHLAITPVTALAYSAGEALKGLGAAVAWKSLEHDLSDVALGLTALLALGVAWRTNWSNLVPGAGLVLLVAVLGGPAAWPWYLSWALVVLAARPATQRSASAVAVLGAAIFLVKPNGILSLPLQSAPVVLGLAAGATAVFFYVRRDDHLIATARRAVTGRGARPGGAVGGLS